jgi:hypothetical protein
MENHESHAMKRLLVALLVMGSFAPVHAGMLYKSVGPDGTIMFSDVPPAGDARIVEQRVIPSYGGSSGVSSGGAPIALVAASPLQLLDSDEAVQRANAEVDHAEHALALARRGTWSANEGLRLPATRTSLQDAQQVEFYKRNLRASRQRLVDVLHDRQSPQGVGRVMVSANY